jgi:hypothetical protein
MAASVCMQIWTWDSQLRTDALPTKLWRLVSDKQKTRTVSSLHYASEKSYYYLLMQFLIPIVYNGTMSKLNYLPVTVLEEM